MQKNKQKIITRVTVVSTALNAFLALFKVIIGFIGHSQALIADGIHSFSDLITDLLVYVTARISGARPDDAHPYGHQRIETLGTIVIALLLFAVAAAIAYDATSQLMHGLIGQKPTLAVIIAAFFSIVSNEWLFHYTRHHGEKIQSNLLISNAWHHRSDAFSSLIVLLAVIGSLSGYPWLDSVGAILIALLIFKMSVKIIWESIQELIDASADAETLAEITRVIESVPGVRSLHQLRTRSHGSSIFVDCHIIVDPFISVSEGHHIGERVHLKLLKDIKNVNDVVVHIDPEDDENTHPSLQLPHRKKIEKLLQTRWSSLPGYNNIQKITPHYLQGKLTIEIVMNPTEHTVATSDLLMQYQKAVIDIDNIADVAIYFTVHSKK